MVTKKNKTVKTAKTVTAKEAPSHHTGPAKTERRLYRSGKDKMLAGVCGGLAEYLNIDVVWIRLFFILMIFAHGGGVLLYLILWIAVPKNPLHRWNNNNSEDEDRDENKTLRSSASLKKEKQDRSNKTSHLYFGFILILLGAFFLGRQLWGPWFSRLFFALALILFGVLLMRKEYAKKGDI